jgi:hypothetical protein
MRILHVEGMIDARTYGLVRRRIDQILSGLEQLSDANVECWSTIELVPLEIDSKDSNSGAGDSRLQQIMLLAADTVRSILTDRPPGVEEAVAPPLQTQLEELEPN